MHLRTRPGGGLASSLGSSLGPSTELSWLSREGHLTGLSFASAGVHSSCTSGGGSTLSDFALSEDDASVAADDVFKELMEAAKVLPRGMEAEEQEVKELIEAPKVLPRGMEAEEPPPSWRSLIEVPDTAAPLEGPPSPSGSWFSEASAELAVAPAEVPVAIEAPPMHGFVPSVRTPAGRQEGQMLQAVPEDAEISNHDDLELSPYSVGASRMSPLYKSPRRWLSPRTGGHHPAARMLLSRGLPVPAARMPYNLESPTGASPSARSSLSLQSEGFYTPTMDNSQLRESQHELLDELDLLLGGCATPDFLRTPAASAQATPIGTPLASGCYNGALPFSPGR